MEQSALRYQLKTLVVNELNSFQVEKNIYIPIEKSYVCKCCKNMIMKLHLSIIQC